MILKPKDNAEWLESRKQGIGGSDAGAVLGLSKYKSNHDVWAEKTGKTVPEDISGKLAVYFGKHAEKHIRELYKLNYPEEKISYHEFWMYCNEQHPWMYATLDGEIRRADGTKGIWECKTTTILNQRQWDEWDDRIPQAYYAQVLHQLACTGWDFAVLYAYIRYYKGEDLRTTSRRFEIKRSEVEGEIEYLIEKESEFWEYVKSGKEPPTILPAI